MNDTRYDIKLLSKIREHFSHQSVLEEETFEKYEEMTKKEMADNDTNI